MRIKPTIRQIFFIALIILLARYSQGQSDYFPKPGDTLYYLVDRAPENINIDGYNRQPIWDISLAKAPYLRPVIPVDPTKIEESGNFPGANYALRMDDRTIHFYKREGRELYLLGLHGFYIFQQFVPVDIRFDYPIIVNYPSAQYGQEWEYSSQATIEFPTSLLQPSIVSRLPVRADSIRLILGVDRLSTEDGEGQLKYEIINDDVSRHFTIEEYRYRTLLKVGDKPWQDFSSYIDNNEAYGPPIRYRYDFFNEKYGIPVSSVWVNPYNRQPTQVKYWVRSYLNRFRKPVQTSEPDIYAFPNPAIGYVNIELSNLKPGKYRIALFNFLAQEVYQQPVEINSDETVRIDITKFDKGPYLYGLIDQYGRRIITKRLTILKP